MIEGNLLENKVRVWEGYEEIHEELYYGKEFEDHLDLSLAEAMHLVERKEIEVYKNDEKIGKEELFDRFTEIDDEFIQKYAVYSDLRERGYILKSGFKFGSHFRVYPRGVNPYKKGPKSQKEHTKWVVHSVPEDHNLSYSEMSRAVRLAQNIRATMLWAVVDSEKGVTYYKMERITP
ncbi:MAG: tRNA-intron lyase [Candidatus Nanohaloarchaeota archaeon QJJ-9]|nr:tRNA-intron lyase [Candidatus Nanohaloarchaeota archaeon QJJ-9]